MPVHWVVLHLEPEGIQERIKNREKMDIYESKKCLEYYSFIYLELAAFYGMTVVNVEKSPEEVGKEIVGLIETGATEEIRALGLKYLSISRIQELEVSNQIISGLRDKDVEEIMSLVEKDIKED